MKVLLTGANGYIGTRLLSLLVEKGHFVIAMVRNPQRIQIPEELQKSVEIFQADLLDPHTLQNLPKDIDAAYYLVHTMGDNPKFFSEKDKISAENFQKAMQNTKCKQIIYLSGLVKEAHLSKHLSSRLEVENILRASSISLTVLRASIVIGSGSASFEIIRDLVETLPMMVTPKWVKKKCQPIAIADVLDYLSGVLGKANCFGKTFEIGGPEEISYKDVLLRYAKKRGLKRILIPVPVLSPRLSSYWLIFITRTNFYLARSLIDSLKNDSIKTDFSIDAILPKKCLTYEEALDLALQKIKQNAVVSSWKEVYVGRDMKKDLDKYIEAPRYGCFFQTTIFSFSKDPQKLMEEIYKHALDFGQVLAIEERRLLLYAERRLPKELWVEFFINAKDGYFQLMQTVTFRPKGLLGRLYWYILYPIHVGIFRKMAKSFLQRAKA